MGFDNEAQRQTWLREILLRIAALVEEDKSMRDEGELESTYAVTLTCLFVVFECARQRVAPSHL